MNADNRSASARGPTGLAARPALGAWLHPLAASGPLLLLSTDFALAHGMKTPVQNPWTGWHVSADVALGAALAVAVYAAGIRRLSRGAARWRALRHGSFLAGVAVVILALVSPIDALGKHNFLTHQVQHFLLRMLAPMLLMLAAPQAMLILGLPGAVRRAVVVPLLESRSVRAAFGGLVQPVVATALFIATLYVWQIPVLHRLALLDDAVHYLMHATMLAAGVLFFWRIFDARPAPKATGFGVRIVMLGSVLASQILLGAYLTLKSAVLYPVYDTVGRVGAESPLADETLGGIVVWIPSAMMAIIAILIVMHGWGRREALEERRRAPGAREAAPVTRAELMQQVSGRNRALALGFLVVAIVAFSAAIAVGLLGEMVHA